MGAAMDLHSWCLWWAVARWTCGLAEGEASMRGVLPLLRVAALDPTVTLGLGTRVNLANDVQLAGQVPEDGEDEATEEDRVMGDPR